jgi:hypothetical protein
MLLHVANKCTKFAHIARDSILAKYIRVYNSDPRLFSDFPQETPTSLVLDQFYRQAKLTAQWKPLSHRSRALHTHSVRKMLPLNRSNSILCVRWFAWINEGLDNDKHAQLLF